MEWVLPAGVAVCLLLAASAAMSGYALHLAVQSRIDVKALMNSTHSVQMVPVDSPDVVQTDDDDLNKAVNRAEERDFEDMDEIHQRSDALL